MLALQLYRKRNSGRTEERVANSSQRSKKKTSPKLCYQIFILKSSIAFMTSSASLLYLEQFYG